MTKLILFAVATLSMASAFAGGVEPTEADALKASEAFDMGCNEGIPKTTTEVVYQQPSKRTEPADAANSVKYFVVTCTAGAYNENSVLFRRERQFNGADFVQALVPVALVTPMTNQAGKVAGFTAEIVNPYISYDKAKNELTTFAKGRGIGDSFVEATYALYGNQVVLRKYVVDDTFDGKVNPKTVYETKVKFE